MSLARLHRTRMLAMAAAASVATAAHPIEAAATEYELQKAKLGQDLQRLRNIQSTEGKIALKRELLPSYAAWVQGVLDAAAAGAGGAEDIVLVHVMIWRMDVGDFEGAIPLMRYVLRHRLALPERFDRTAATLIAEETAEAALKRLGQGEAFDLEILSVVDMLTEDEDMPDQARAKLKKAIGLELARFAGEIETGADGPAAGKRAAVEGALRALRRALELNGSAGVKKDIQRLEREAKALAEAAGATGQGDPQ